MHTCSSHSSIDLKDDKFFLCNKPAESEALHNASIYDIDMKVHRCIYDIDVKVHRCTTELEGTALLAKLNLGT